MEATWRRAAPASRAGRGAAPAPGDTAEGEPQFPDASKCHTGGNVLTAFLCVLFGFMGLLQMLPGVTALAAARTAAAKIFATLDAPAPAIEAPLAVPHASAASVPRGAGAGTVAA